MLYVYDRHEGYDFHVWHAAGAPRADVSVFTPDGRQHAAFELGVIAPNAKDIAHRLRRTLIAWIDGAINEGSFT